MSLDPDNTLPSLKPFSLTHILYDPLHPLSIPFTLLSLTPIFLFVSYLTLIIFTRRLTILILSLGSILNEVLSLILKEWLKGDRPYKGLLGEVGDGYGMPSSHSQAAGFLVGWGISYALDIDHRRETRVNEVEGTIHVIRSVRRSILVFGLILWSILVAYSRYHLHYHSLFQVIVGYLIGLIAGAAYFMITEYIPLHHPASIPRKLRRGIEWVWKGFGGVGGWQLGDAIGGWGEGHFFLSDVEGKRGKKKE